MAASRRSTRASAIKCPAPLYFRVKLMAEGEMCLSRQQCPLWVKSKHMQCNRRCPLYPQERRQKQTSAKGHVCFTPKSGHVQCNGRCLLWPNSGHSRRVRPFIDIRYRRDVEHARARPLYRFRSGLLAGPAIQNNNPDHGCDDQRATESRCQCPVIYCRDLHVCRLGGAANGICEVGHKATGNMCGATRDVRFGPIAVIPPHSTTSSAATSKPGGTVRPRAFAVLMLTDVSNFVGACTGSSAGLSPRKMRST